MILHDGRSGADTAVRRQSKGRFRALGASLLDLLLPRRCAGCRSTWLSSHEGSWCGDCLERLPRIASPLCPRCGIPYPDSPTSPDHLCGNCLLTASPIDRARAAAFYAGVIRDRIHQLKFGGRLEWVPPLADLLAETAVREGMASADMLVPVPLHVKRLQERGFNQSGLLAGALGRRIGIPCRYDALARGNRTRQQTRLSREERLRNLKGAFLVLKPEAVRGRRILLIDDVYTTGTTLTECARTLKAGGAAEVHALTVARTLLDHRESGKDIE